MQTMRVSLINLGDAPRVLYDRRQLPVFIGIGKIVDADMGPHALASIEKFKATETLVVAPIGEGVIPPELRAIVDLLAVIEFEEYDKLLRRMFEITPVADQTRMRPTRASMRVQLRALIEDYISAMTKKSRRVVRDDVDPEKLRKELEEQNRQPPPAQHALAPRPSKPLRQRRR